MYISYNVCGIKKKLYLGKTIKFSEPMKLYEHISDPDLIGIKCKRHELRYFRWKIVIYLQRWFELCVLNAVFQFFDITGLSPGNFHDDFSGPTVCAVEPG